MQKIKPKQLKKDRLLDQGVALLLEKGYHATGLKEILDTVQIPKGSFYNYFDSKEAFAAAAITHYIEPFIIRLSGYLEDPEADGLAALRSYYLAFDHAKGLNPTAKDPRQWFYSAQQGVESFLAMITSGSFRTNVIITAHVRYSQNDDGTTKGYPNAIGSALGPQIPRYFNHWAQCVSKAGKRSIQTAATNMMDLKNTKPFEMKSTYPLESGLADFFAVLRDPPAKIEKPKAITLKRM